MKNILAVILCNLIILSSYAQVDNAKVQSPYVFTKIKENGAVAVENQCKSGTCWSFATISFLESEILRINNKKIDLSEMFNVYHIYRQKADSYVRYQGKQQFGPGGLSHDVLMVMDNYGIVPESAYRGLEVGNDVHDHGAMDAILEGSLKVVLDNKLNTQNNNWKKNIDGILEANLGKVPETFEFDGKKYTPASFRDAMSIKASDYVSLTSYNHHPFYSNFVLEVPDNWAKGSFYNLPLNELQQVIDNAIDKGYTVSWDADVSEKGFSFDNGVAILPADGVTKDQLFKQVVAEQLVDQSNRQDAFDQFKTTDDHLMHIVGKAKDQNGNMYYITKNSWGTSNLFEGYQYVSANYFLMKTISITLHKSAIPEAIKTKAKI